jgi:uncharacterized phage protein
MSKKRGYFDLSDACTDLKDADGAAETTISSGKLLGKTLFNTVRFAGTTLLDETIKKVSKDKIKRLESAPQRKEQNKIEKEKEKEIEIEKEKNRIKEVENRKRKRAEKDKAYDEKQQKEQATKEQCPYCLGTRMSDNGKQYCKTCGGTGKAVK